MRMKLTVVLDFKSHAPMSKLEVLLSQKFHENATPEDLFPIYSEMTESNLQ